MTHLPTRRTARPGIDELELWPDLMWHLAALLKAGVSPAFALAKATEEVAGRQRHLEQQPQGLLVRWDREATGLLVAVGDLQHLLSSCLLAAERGAPVSQACLHSVQMLARPTSLERALSLAACWQVSERTGAPLAEVLERFARYLENDIDLLQMREAAMGGPKATGRILSWLPLLGLGLGLVMGADPLGVLFGSVLGALICCVGLALALVGSRWTARLIRRAEKGEL
ncbi:type II secretion system F family protein [Rothia sp. (in: high G+C Gram-positive bacteria)]|uniref:type II secretion system F family protein n=1 Tax=Rothia sp. (in: high G+C Gram-positive bacteria) TaxID=1885016 RepID=UPI000ED4111C|nr:hypothetical protein [Rothia sp. (in: high G+C Gram-positive bacteria)]